MRNFIFTLFSVLALSGCAPNQNDQTDKLQAQIDDLQGQVSDLQDKVSDVDDRVSTLENH